MKIAFYKANAKGIHSMVSRFVRFFNNGPYSHTELIFSDGMSASASLMDHGVRFKMIDFSPLKWDIFDLPDYLDEDYARQWYRDHEGKSYDIRGVLRFVFPFLKDSPDKWFCSETQAAAFRMQNPVQYGPNDLAEAMGFLRN